ncbi:MAG TPA: hypothetical protein VFE53_21065 [Mucilaginibacter sp.]|jgi:hypothetical protein|nr:hypothetical protein [Mucilaginibacter sp.]
MRFLYKLLAAMLFFPLFAAAQSNYQPGYVVTAKGDTVKGFIDYRAWDNNPVSIYFKSDLNEPAKKTFTLNDISFFNVIGLAAYKKFVVSVSMDITDPNKLANRRDTSFKVDTIFLKILQEGKRVALYSYTDDLKTRFYVGETPDYEPKELIYRRYIDENTVGNTMVENIYQKQLFAISLKYRTLDDKSTAALEDPFLSYRRDDLLKIVSRINNISQADYEKTYAQRSKISFYAGATANWLNTTSAPGSGYTMGGGGASNSLSPGVVFGVAAQPDPDHGKVDFRADLSVNPGRFNEVFALKVSPYGQARTSYSQLGVFFDPHVIFDIYSSPNFKFYLGLGLSLDYFIFSNEYFQSLSSSSNPFFPKEPFYFNNINVAFLATGGITIHKRWEIYFNYLTATSTTGGDYFFLSDQIKQLGISYFFDR